MGLLGKPNEIIYMKCSAWGLAHVRAESMLDILIFVVENSNKMLKIKKKKENTLNNNWIDLIQLSLIFLLSVI